MFLVTPVLILCEMVALCLTSEEDILEEILVPRFEVTLTDIFQKKHMLLV